MMNFNQPVYKVITIVFCQVILLSGTGFGQQFAVTKSEEGVRVIENGKNVLFYQTHPKSLDGKYERAGYVHPLYGLNGEVLTEDFPDDHPYHHGIFWTWHQILWKDKKVADAWISENILWKPVSVNVLKAKEHVRLHSVFLWEISGKNIHPKAVIREDTRITVHALDGNHRALDFDIRLFALVDSLKIGGADDVKGYGGFCLRLRLPDDISFFSGDSVVIPRETAVAAGDWMDFNGSFEGKSFLKTGLAVFCLPVNDAHTQQWILRKEKSMQNVVYPGRKPVPLPKKGLRLRYRLIIHNGEIGNRELEKLYQQYIQAAA